MEAVTTYLGARTGKRDILRALKTFSDNKLVIK